MTQLLLLHVTFSDHPSNSLHVAASVSPSLTLYVCLSLCEDLPMCRYWPILLMPCPSTRQIFMPTCRQ